jgi:hypothetical protein
VNALKGACSLAKISLNQKHYLFTGSLPFIYLFIIIIIDYRL